MRRQKHKALCQSGSRGWDIGVQKIWLVRRTLGVCSRIVWYRPELSQVIEQPENHLTQFPSLLLVQILYYAWNGAILDSDRLQTICKGAITGVLKEPRPEMKI